jgi:drug/metabolite transporter (DMT)-like permease
VGRRAAGPPLAVTAENFVRAVPFALLASGAGLRAAHVTSDGALLAIASGAIASGVGYALWYAALRGLTATRAALVQLSVPALAAAAGVLLLGEPPSLRLIVSGAVILGGVALAVLAGR